MNNCIEHDWSWDDDDYGCPVCYGMRLEQERIIALLEADEVLHDIWWVVYRDIEPFPESGRLSQWEIAEVLKDRLGLIKGETK